MEFTAYPADPKAYLPPQKSEEDVMHEAEERALDIRARLHQDMHTTVVSQFAGDHAVSDLIDALCDDAMFQIEHLLVEIEAMHIKDRAKSSGSVTEPGLGWPDV